MTIDPIFFQAEFGVSKHHGHHRHHGHHKYYAYNNSNNWGDLSRWSSWGNNRTIIDDVLDRDFYPAHNFHHRKQVFGWNTPFTSNFDRYNYHHRALTHHRLNNDFWSTAQYDWQPKLASDIVQDIATSPYLYPPAWTRDSWN